MEHEGSREGLFEQRQEAHETAIGLVSGSRWLADGANERHREDVRDRRTRRLEDWYEDKINFCRRADERRAFLADEAQSRTRAQQSRLRHRAWWVVVALCSRLEAMRECLKDNQDRRALYQRRKNAAVRIASWYKEILTTRRHLYLIESCRRFKNFSSAFFERSKVRVRRKCAGRILDFMLRDVNANRVSFAVQQLKRFTVVIQRAWRTRLATKEAQIALLSLQLSKFESRLLAFNRRKATANNASVFAATARKTVPLHEEMRQTLSCTFAGLTLRDGSTGQRQRRVKMDDEEDDMTPQQMLFLNTLTVRLPQAIKDKVVQERRREDERRFYHKWDSYVANRKVYATQKPIDDARIKLLASAGIAAESQVLEPTRPKLRVLQGASALAAMLDKGLRMLIDKGHDTAPTHKTARRSVLGQRL